LRRATLRVVVARFALPTLQGLLIEARCAALRLPPPASGKGWGEGRFDSSDLMRCPSPVSHLTMRDDLFRKRGEVKICTRLNRLFSLLVNLLATNAA